MNMDAALQTFLAESHELLQAVEDGLLHLEENPGDTETLHALFRAAHTIKGSAGMFGLDPISGFTHSVENVLSHLRDGALALDGALAELLLACRDHIRALVERLVTEGGEMDAELEAAGEALKRRLGVYLGEQPAATERSVSPSTPAAAKGAWHISLRFSPGVLRLGLDPLAFLRYLRKLGEVGPVVTITDALPDAERMDPETCYLGFEVCFIGEVERSAIEGAFEFVREDCQLRIVAPGAPASAWKELLEALPEGKERAAKQVMAAGVLDAATCDAILHPKEAASAPVPAAAPAPAAPRAGAPGAGVAVGTLRVDATRLDHLVNLVGELVIAVAGAGTLARNTGLETLREANDEVARLVEEVRDTSLRLRMVPIGETFNRFRRVVHDGARDLGKKIELVTYGADTELDKVVAEKIGDPLTHLVRNAMDHGLEMPAVRLAKGKPESGTIQLDAYYDSGSVVIEVADDGAGLDRDRIYAKAMERGLIGHGQVLSDVDVYRLIFEPGFSTADQVSNLSGRGVGMDVVRRNIEALRGTVELESDPGEGTTVRIRLPLTLSIIDGFLLKVGETAYVVPLQMLVECIEVGDEECLVDERHQYLDLRGEVLPFLRLRGLFGIGEGDEDDAPRENIAIVQWGEHKAGLVVDELVGECQAVVKPLGAVFRELRGISGATILGTGEVALILDVPGLVQWATEASQFSTAGMSTPGGAFDSPMRIVRQ